MSGFFKLFSFRWGSKVYFVHTATEMLRYFRFCVRAGNEFYYPHDPAAIIPLLESRDLMVMMISRSGNYYMVMHLAS